MRIVKPNESVPLFLQLDQDDDSQYPQAIIINAAGTIVGTVSLSNVSNVGGKYLGTHVFTIVNDYSVKYIVYSDASHTNINTKYRFADETIRVSEMEQNIEDILNGNLGEPIAIFD